MKPKMPKGVIVGNWQINVKENKVRNRDTKEVFTMFEPIKFDEDETKNVKKD